MPRFLFPFPMGAEPGAAPPPPPPPPPFWTKLARGALTWQFVTAGQLPRFEHIYPQEAGAEQQFVKVPPPD